MVKSPNDGISRRSALAAMGIMAAAALPLGSSIALADTECCVTLSLENMREISTPEADRLYYLHEPGMEGFFLYDASDTDSGDNWGIVVTAGSARFKRVYEDWINVRWFGAIGTGASRLLSADFSTLGEAQTYFPHATLTDEWDWVAIQAAILAAADPDARTRKVYIPSGTYRLNQALSLSSDRLEIRGGGGTILTITAQTKAIEVAKMASSVYVPVNGLVIRDLSIDAGNGPATGGIIDLHYATDVIVEHVRIEANNASLRTAGAACNGILAADGTSGSIQHTVVSGTTGPAIALVDGAQSVRLERCNVSGTIGATGTHAGIYLADCAKVLISECRSRHNQGAGLHIQTSDGVEVERVLVAGGEYSDNGTHGVLLTSDTDGANPDHIQLSDVTTVGNNGDGLRIEAGVHLSVMSHIAHNNGESGINVSQLHTSSANLNVSRVKVGGAILYNNGQSATAAGITICATSWLAIRGSAVYDDQSSATQDYGIRIVSDPNSKVPQQLIVQDNRVYGHATDYDLSSVQAASGHYRIAYTLPSAATPENIIAAPFGSEYIDRTAGAGRKFIKASGSGTTGWKKITFV